MAQLEEGGRQPNTHEFAIDGDHLYCKEEHGMMDAEDQQQILEKSAHPNYTTISVPSPNLRLYLSQQHPLELQLLLFKEHQTHVRLPITTNLQADSSLNAARREAVHWILSVTSYYTFSALTAVLSVHYLDLFLGSFQTKTHMPWVVQLAAVACLSLAAKLEETHVPLLFDLQVEKSKYMFEPKSIQRMELLVLSTLDWKMNLVTPISFLNHISERLRLVNHRQTEFITLFELLLLSLITDSRFVEYPPSIFAAAITLHVMKQMGCCGQIDYYKNQLYDILKFSKDKFEGCYQLIQTECQSRSQSSRQ